MKFIQSARGRELHEALLFNFAQKKLQAHAVDLVAVYFIAGGLPDYPDHHLDVVLQSVGQIHSDGCSVSRQYEYNSVCVVLLSAAWALIFIWAAYAVIANRMWRRNPGIDGRIAPVEAL